MCPLCDIINPVRRDDCSRCNTDRAESQQRNTDGGDGSGGGEADVTTNGGGVVARSYRELTRLKLFRTSSERHELQALCAEARLYGVARIPSSFRLTGDELMNLCRAPTVMATGFPLATKVWPNPPRGKGSGGRPAPVLVGNMAGTNRVAPSVQSSSNNNNNNNSSSGRHEEGPKRYGLNVHDAAHISTALGENARGKGGGGGVVGSDSSGNGVKAAQRFTPIHSTIAVHSPGALDSPGAPGSMALASSPPLTGLGLHGSPSPPLPAAHATPHSLMLYNGYLGNRGVEALSLGLAHNTSLRKLVLGAHSVRWRGAAALAHALRHRPVRLRALVLEGNVIGDEGALALAAAIDRTGGGAALCPHPNGLLEELRVVQAGITAEGAGALALAFGRAAVMSITARGGHRGSDLFAVSTSNATTAAKVLTAAVIFDLSDNVIECEGARLVARHLFAPMKTTMQALLKTFSPLSAAAARVAKKAAEAEAKAEVVGQGAGGGNTIRTVGHRRIPRVPPTPDSNEGDDDNNDEEDEDDGAAATLTWRPSRRPVIRVSLALANCQIRTRGMRAICEAIAESQSRGGKKTKPPQQAQQRQRQPPPPPSPKIISPPLSNGTGKGKGKDKGNGAARPLSVVEARAAAMQAASSASSAGKRARVLAGEAAGGERPLPWLPSSADCCVVLSSLDMSMNWVDDTGGQALARCLCQDRELVHCDLFDNELGEKAAKLLLSALRRNMALETLELGENGAISGERRILLSAQMEARNFVWQQMEGGGGVIGGIEAIGSGDVAGLSSLFHSPTKGSASSSSPSPHRKRKGAGASLAPLALLGGVTEAAVAGGEHGIGQVTWVGKDGRGGARGGGRGTGQEDDDAEAENDDVWAARLETFNAAVRRRTQQVNRHHASVAPQREEAHVLKRDYEKAVKRVKEVEAQRAAKATKELNAASATAKMELGLEGGMKDGTEVHARGWASGYLAENNGKSVAAAMGDGQIVFELHGEFNDVMAKSVGEEEMWERSKIVEHGEGVGE